MQPMPNSSLPSSRANVGPCNELEVASFRFRGRQRKRHNSFLCFPSKKLTAKIYHIRLTGQFMRTRIQEIFTNESNTKASIQDTRESTKLMNGRCRDWRRFWLKRENCVVPCCVTQQDNFTLNCDPKSIYNG